ncbi:MAG TPA: PH domain-containing protein [Candidatus Limnocylindria bacterium]|nr:PH domain-containing protein [Candidatus Limnocylindria bacterium]
MSYARNLLSRGEEVVFESRQHWFAVLARTWFFILLAVLALAVLIYTTSSTDGGGAWGFLQIASIVGLIVSLGYIGWVIWDWRNQEWLITTRRVVRAEGILNKQMADSSLEKINDARLTQSWVGRVFNYGTLDILTAAEEVGGTSVADFPMIADPVQFKVAMLNQKEMLERPDLAPARTQRPTPLPAMQRAEPMPARAGSDRVQEVRDEPMPPPPPSPASPPPTPVPAPEHAAPPGDRLTATLESLAALRDRGLITPEEYDAKKRELLERM